MKYKFYYGQKVTVCDSDSFYNGSSGVVTHAEGEMYQVSFDNLIVPDEKLVTSFNWKSLTKASE
jgi:hypothetical protein